MAAITVQPQQQTATIVRMPSTQPPSPTLHHLAISKLHLSLARSAHEKSEFKLKSEKPKPKERLKAEGSDKRDTLAMPLNTLSAQS